MESYQFFDVVIVGAGHAGAQAAIALRAAKFTGTLALVGEEPDLPYERPPLSKEYLSGERAFERILIRPAAFWTERQVSMLLGQRVVKVDADEHRIRTADGTTIGYGQLIWATGGAPRQLTCSGHDAQGVHTVRTRGDADRLIAELPSSSRVVVIGGGYIGLESAAMAVKAGKEVTILEAQPRVLARVAGETLSRFYEAEHRAHGVDVRLEATVTCITEVDGWVNGVELADGMIVAADMVIVGVGIVPAVQPLLDAGATGTNGVDVDAQCRTDLPDVFAIGDCAAHRNAFADGARIRLESVQNANDQATVAAKAIASTPVDYDAVPWFWSNQYDLRLQTVGLSIGYDETIVRGDVADRSFSLIYLREGRVIALDCVNRTKDYVQGRALVLGRTYPDRKRLEDTGISLKEVEQLT